MLEILFGDSACVSLKMAQRYGKGNYSGGAVGVIISHANGSKATKKELKAAQLKAEEKLRLDWGNAVPMGGNSADIFALNLALSVGKIAEDTIGEERRRTFDLLCGKIPDGDGVQPSKKLLNRATENLEIIHKRAVTGELIRIWYSNEPDDMCGLYWFMSQIKNWGVVEPQIVTIKLPKWEEENGNVVQRTGWGEVSPEGWYRYLKLQKPMPFLLIQSYAFCWRALQKENAPLRAVINGKLVSAPENLYDSFIYREIAKEKEEFNEANVVGNVIGQYQLGIGVWWIALRIEEMIKAGELQIVSAQEQDELSYRKVLRKC